jgi:hypothetical protein
MPDLNSAHTLRALSHVKEVRKSLAEAEYLRRLRQQRDLRQDWRSHDQRLEHSKSILPRQKAVILTELAARPVDIRKIHSAHETVRTLDRRIEMLEQKRREIQEKHREACDKEAAARRNFTVATRQLQKFHEIKTRCDKLIIRQSDEQEQAELEDRMHSRSHLITTEGK